LRSFAALRKEAGLFCGSSLRKGAVFAYVGLFQNLKDFRFCRKGLDPTKRVWALPLTRCTEMMRGRSCLSHEGHPLPAVGNIGVCRRLPVVVCARTGSWTGPPRGKRVPRVEISSTVFGIPTLGALFPRGGPVQGPVLTDCRNPANGHPSKFGCWSWGGVRFLASEVPLWST